MPLKVTLRVAEGLRAQASAVQDYSRRRVAAIEWQRSLSVGLAGVSMFWAALFGALAALLVGADGIEPPTFAL